MVKDNMLWDDIKLFFSSRKSLHDNTIVSYCSHIKRFIVFIDNEEPTKELLEKYIYSLKKEHRSNRTINTIMAALIAYEEYLNARGKESNFTKGFKTLKVERKIVDILTPDEIKRILSTPLVRKGTSSQLITDKNFLFFTEMLAYSGARFSEIANLRVNKVYDDYIQLEETKNSLARKVYLNPYIMEKLQLWIKDKDAQDLVITTTTGNKMHPGDTLMNLRRRFIKAGVKKKAYPHVFRHSFATQLAIDGAKTEEIKEILGHKDIQTTLYYVHLADSTIKKATFKHSLNREAMTIGDILRDIKDAVFSFNIDRDNRFQVQVSESSTQLILDIHAR